MRVFREGAGALKKLANLAKKNPEGDTSSPPQDPCATSSSGPAGDTYFVGLTISVYAMGGVEVSADYHINLGVGPSRFDFGHYVSVGAGGGINVGAGVQAGFVRGGSANLRGAAAESTLGVGPVSASWYESPPGSQNTLGWAATLGASQPPVAGNRSVTYSHTSSVVPWNGCR
jgi:hypothetical protein